jgi:Fic family protein
MKNITGLYQQWQSMKPLSEENQARLDRKFNLEFNYNSNHLEGNTLTYGQTELLLMFGDTTGDAKLRDYEEMQAHNVALRAIRDEAADTSKPLTEKFIRDLNALILVKPFYKDALAPDGSKTRMKVNIGNYKTCPNHVLTATGETFYYASPEETPAMMSALVEWFNEHDKAGDYHPLELASLLHYRFIRIHPFEDGNGRIARLLVNYVLMRHDYPMVIIKSERKDEYLAALHRADVNVGLTPSDGANAELPQIEPFVECMSEQMEYSLELCIRAAKGESLDEPGDLAKKLLNLKKELGTPQEEVQLMHSEETVKNIVEKSVFPLMKAWEKVLKQFDSIVYGRWYDATCSHGLESDVRKQARNLYLLLEELKSDYVFINNYGDLQTITAHIQERGIIGIDHSTIMDGGFIEFNFYPNVYEISNSVNSKVLTKLYHQPLSEEEINEIVEALGNQLVENIEKVRQAGKS